MKKDLMWAFWVNISNHMWDDDLSGNPNWYMPKTWQETNNVDWNSWDNVMKYIAELKFNTVLIDVGDGVKLDSHPEIVAPDAVSKEFLMKKLDEARALGLTPYPKLNFSTCHHQWLKEYSYMVGTQKYRDVACEIINEVSEIFGKPAYFHLGMDEEDAIGCFNNRGFVSFRREKLLWKDFYTFFDAVEKNGGRPWVWSDYYWNNPDLFVKYMPKEVLQSNWYYGYFRDNMAPDSYGAKAIAAYEALDKLGYDQVPTSSTWNNNVNTIQTLYHGKKVISEEHLVGYMTAPWSQVEAYLENFQKSDASVMYHGRELAYPETLE